MKKLDDSILEYFRQAHPIILFGMHRSGTSMMARLLMRCEVFMGRRLSINSECIFLRGLNKNIFKRSGAKWSKIGSLTKAMSSEKCVYEEVAKLHKSLFEKGKIRQFFDPQIWNMIYDHNPPVWGWKDPRTTITFPVWKEVFPKAKFIHMIRNGVDVAISLHKRALSSSQWWKRLKSSYNYSAKMLDFSNCFRLWEDYVTFALKYKKMIQNDCYLEVFYEDVLLDPMGALERISDFGGLAVEKNELRKICKLIDRTRIDNSKFIAQYQQEIDLLSDSPMLKILGY